MAILSGLLAATLGRWLGKRRRFLAAALSTLLLIAYDLLVGAAPSVVRAALTWPVPIDWHSIEIPETQMADLDTALVGAMTNLCLLILDNPRCSSHSE